MLGRYINKNTIIHRLDPRLKFLSLIFITVMLFIPGIGFYGLLAVFLLLIFGLIFGKIPLSYILSPLKFMWIMFIILIILNLISIRTGSLLLTIPVHFWFFNFTIKVYSGALIQTAFIFGRVFIMMLLSIVLTATTRPMELNYALEFLMYPLKFIKFPVVEVSMMISLALRFIPTISMETQKLMMAQESRGAKFRTGNIFKRLLAIISLLVPLFVASFERSEQLANAMEVRGYDLKVKRTKYHKLSFHLCDGVFSLLLILDLTFLILLRIFL
jgi:energy-coupling factor transport system permease protein